jgi:hypothetical protein
MSVSGRGEAGISPTAVSSSSCISSGACLNMNLRLERIGEIDSLARENMQIQELHRAPSISQGFLNTIISGMRSRSINLVGFRAICCQGMEADSPLPVRCAKSVIHC